MKFSNFKDPKMYVEFANVNPKLNSIHTFFTNMTVFYYRFLPFIS